MKMGLSPSLMDQEGTPNLNSEVAHIAQENFMIGQFAKMNLFHWSRCPWQYLNHF